MAKNNKDQLILNALLTYPSVREAAEAINVSESVIYLRLRDSTFKQKYNEAKDQMLHNTTTFLQSKLQEATSVIVSLMNDVETAPQVRLNAARATFEYCIKLTEQTELLRRIEAIEQAQNTDN